MVGRRSVAGRWAGIALALALGAALVVVPASSRENRTTAKPFLSKVSQPVAIRYFMAHPAQAPKDVAAALSKITPQAPRSPQSASVSGTVFNHDNTGLPQNEESITACHRRPNVVLGGTNDYRGLLSPVGNFTGWHFSVDGGRTVANEGLLPPVSEHGQQVESGGDPVTAAGPGCGLYAADLNYDAVPQGDLVPNGVGVYRTTPARLRSCAGGESAACWPVRRAVAVNPDPHVFLDKPWMYVGRTAGKTYVWVVYTQFECPDVGCASGLYNANQIKAVRCNASLSSCTQPILISGRQPSIQFGDVTIGPDGRTYITWEQDNDLATNFSPPEHMRFWIRVAPPGSTHFGPPHLVAKEPLNAGIAPLHANDFRIATYPKNAVAMVRGKARVFVTWEGCRARPLGGSVCEEPRIKLVHSDDHGTTWSRPQVISAGGDNYFPTISADLTNHHIDVAYYTNRFDPAFHNRQDVELTTLGVGSSRVIARHRITATSNETESDPILGGAFIGDYFEVFADHGRALLHYNANYRKEKLLGEGVPVNQQDNFLARTGD